MFMSTKFVLAALGSAAALFGSAAAAPTIAPLDVYDPPVLVPNFATVWHPGEKTNVTWDVSDPPAQITNPIARVYLVQGPNDVSISGPGGASDPLASNISILQGTVAVTVPQVAPGVYKVVVFGDSGNAGEPFTIL